MSKTLYRTIYTVALSAVVILGVQSCSPGFVQDRQPLALEKALSVPVPSELVEFPVFESGPVRPLALSADGKKLFAANIPDGRLEIFEVSGDTLKLSQSVAVGLEPVAVAVRKNGEVWVVNHLSDSISIVDTTQNPARVVRTLLVGDEPSDIVFAGPDDSLAFVTAAHRGQNAPFDPQLKTPGVSRADVWVFDTRQTDSKLGGTPRVILNMFGDTTRALARNPEGSQVYTAVMNSGNRTTTIMPHHPFPRLEKPTPTDNHAGDNAPHTGLVVRYDGKNWVDNGDPLNGVEPAQWTDYVRFSLPDNDVFTIDAMADPPVAIKAYQGVGTSLFNIAVNPVNQNLYVSNTEARNVVRFEGMGERNTTVRGHFAESRITVIDGDAVLPRHLNKHIKSYDRPLGTLEENALSVAMPLQMQVSADGRQLYVAAFSSAKVAVYNTAELEADSFQPALVNQISLSGGGPGGLVLDETRQRLYVHTRFNNGISVIDTQQRREIAAVQMYNPEPEAIVRGRPFLYDASVTSSRGDSSCGACHIFADMDHLAWDLGDPEGSVTANPRDYVFFSGAAKPYFHPMKGPMTTQSMRGLPGHGPMHWRGDRTGASAEPGETLEEQAFEDFNVAFVGLLGREHELSEAQMDDFARFAMALYYPPNPIRNLDNSLTSSQSAGRHAFFNTGTTVRGRFACSFCHTLDVKKRRFGTAGLMTVEGITVDEDLKVPHLRNIYQKLGMFGGTGDPHDGRPFAGEQIRGFGLMHDGSMDTVTNFFIEGSRRGGAMFVFDNEEVRENLADFVHVMDAELAPIVGQQVTLTAETTNNQGMAERLSLLYARAMIVEPRPECDLIAKGVVDDQTFGALLMPSGLFKADKAAMPAQSLWALQQLATQKNNSLTFTCVPPGSGHRQGIDRDVDGVLDGDEIAERYSGEVSAEAMSTVLASPSRIGSS